MRIPGLKNKGFINKISTNAQDSAADILKMQQKALVPAHPRIYKNLSTHWALTMLLW